MGVQGDVSKVEDCGAIVQTAIDTFGKLDVLCNNAGIMDNFAGPADVDDAIFMRVMSINSFGPAVPDSCGHPAHAREWRRTIVNSASLAGIGGGAAGVPTP